MMSTQEAGSGRMDGLWALEAMGVEGNSCKCLEREFFKAFGLGFKS